MTTDHSGDQFAGGAAVPSRRRATTATSVCTGSLLLAAAGLLPGLEATTHWASTDELDTKAVQLMVEYDPQPPFDAGSVEKAGPPVRARAEKLFQDKDRVRRTRLHQLLEADRGQQVELVAGVRAGSWHGDGQAQVGGLGDEDAGVQGDVADLRVHHGLAGALVDVHGR